MPKLMHMLCTPIISTWLLLAAAPAFAQPADPALQGSISSNREGAMEGVVVSARQTGSTIAVSVVSDAEGKYSFPVSRLQPGHYDLSTRAAGYVLAGARSVEIAEGKTAVADLRLEPVSELAEQLTNAE